MLLYFTYLRVSSYKKRYETIHLLPIVAKYPGHPSTLHLPNKKPTQKPTYNLEHFQILSRGTPQKHQPLGHENLDFMTVPGINGSEREAGSNPIFATGKKETPRDPGDQYGSLLQLCYGGPPGDGF